jgi:hypothetical protein
MLNHLADMVANGIRTSSGFRKVHLNMCAHALNDQFKIKYSEENVKNHLRTYLSSLLALYNLGFYTCCFHYFLYNLFEFL